MSHYRVPSLPPPPASASLRETLGNPAASASGTTEQQATTKTTTSNANTSQSSNSPGTSHSMRLSISKFDMEIFRPQLQKLCHAHLAHTKWEAAKAKEWSSLLGNAAKQKMIEQEPKGYKYIVSVSLSQNLGQQGRGDAQLHGDPEYDGMTGLVWSNDSMIVTIFACAIRTVY